MHSVSDLMLIYMIYHCSESVESKKRLSDCYLKCDKKIHKISFILTAGPEHAHNQNCYDNTRWYYVFYEWAINNR